jgi:uncharacterized protein
MNAMKLLRLVLSASLLLAASSSHATSFDCRRGRSVPEQLICHTALLSQLDDVLGRLYWQARRRVAHPRAFRADSDSKWAWREAHCTDEACLETWYRGRIGELQQLLAHLGTPAADGVGHTPPGGPRGAARAFAAPASAVAFAVPVIDRTRPAAEAGASSGTESASLACTAAAPGLAISEQCPTVLQQNARWRDAPHGVDWFCGVATLAQASARAQ